MRGAGGGAEAENRQVEGFRCRTAGYPQEFIRAILPLGWAFEANPSYLTAV